MKIVFLTVGSKGDEWYTKATAHYLEKLKPLMNFSFESLRGSRAERSSADQKKQDESETLLKFLRDDDFVVLFDEKGRSNNSLEFSQKLNRYLLSGKKRVVFVIGGAFGVSDELKSRANDTVNLSAWVLNHQVATVVALEGIYRASTILKGLPYHNA